MLKARLYVAKACKARDALGAFSATCNDRLVAAHGAGLRLSATCKVKAWISGVQSRAQRIRLMGGGRVVLVFAGDLWVCRSRVEAKTLSGTAGRSRLSKGHERERVREREREQDRDHSSLDSLDYTRLQ